MLILRPVNGVYYVLSSEFPDGHWAAYTDEDVAREFIQWLTIQKHDCVGLLTRLHFGKLTEADKKLANLITYASKHSTRVVSRKPALIHQMAAARLKTVKPV